MPQTICTISDQEIISNLEPLLQKNDIDNAIKYCNSIHTQAKGSFYLHYYLGKIFFVQNDARQCAKYLTSACAIGCANAFFVNEMGNMFLSLKQIDAARACFLKAWELQPNDQQILINIAATYNVQKNYQESLKYLLQARKISIDANLARKIGLIYFLEQDAKQALVYLTEAISLGASDDITFYTLAQTYASLGDNQKAIEYCHKAIRINKNLPKAYYLLAKLTKLDLVADKWIIDNINQVIADGQITERD